MSYEFDKEQIKKEFREYLKESKEKLPEEVLAILEKYGFSEKTKALKNYIKDKNSDKIKNLIAFTKEALKGIDVKDIIPVSYILLNASMNGTNIDGKQYRQTQFSRKIPLHAMEKALSDKRLMSELSMLVKDWYPTNKSSTIEKWKECITELDKVK